MPSRGRLACQGEPEYIELHQRTLSYASHMMFIIILYLLYYIIVFIYLLYYYLSYMYIMFISYYYIIYPIHQRTLS